MKKILSPGDQSQQSALEIHNLRKIYTNSTVVKEALKGITLSVPRGSIFGLLGPNGAGKSTIINILAGLVFKTSGSASVFGFDIDKDQRRAKAAVGIVPQEINMDPFFTPFEILELQAGLYGVPSSERRTKEILEALHIYDKKDAYVRSMSGGMKRRLLIAKALVHNPPVLILDEPTAGVDVELRHQLWSYVRALHATGTSIILTTHYLEEAEELCDIISVINNGELLLCKEKSALLEDVKRKTVIVQFEKPLDLVPESISSMGKNSITEAKIEQDGSISITFERDKISVLDILDVLRCEKDLTITDVTTRGTNLEDIFIELINVKKQ